MPKCNRFLLNTKIPGDLKHLLLIRITYICSMEQSNRQKKIATLIQKDLVEILQGDAQDGMKGVLISVTKVFVNH